MAKFFFRMLTALAVSLCANAYAYADDGSSLWLGKLAKAADADSTRDIALSELKAWHGNPVNLELIADPYLGTEGFVINLSGSAVNISANSEQGLLYGVYRLLRAQQTGETIQGELREVPAFGLRILNHWDNLDGTIERGYAGKSLWNWDDLPATVSPRYRDYARANASVGINATVLNNVNASPLILSSDYLHKVKALADIFRPYGIRTYLSVNFASPMTLDSLATADPLDPAVRQWWNDKADEIYALIPDFGGFLVKANSEGQPGPIDFGRTHADGANMLAEAVAPHKGNIIWRAFVYSPNDADRAKQAYLEFKPLDGKFADNVIVQIKNGPIDFQPREPYSPLFDGLKQTPMAAELQITQEYLGHSNHLAYLGPMWTEFFGYVSPDKLCAVAGVANIGNEVNWTGHPLAQANWYAFGRLAWNPALDSETIADEWIRQTLVDETTPDLVTESLTEMMVNSRETVVDYMMPLGLHHIFAWGHHYGPEPWCEIPGARLDWLPKYYHQADSAGLGFDRSPSGSNGAAQYDEPFSSLVADISTCPEQFLLWFHHVSWNHRMKSGNTMWEDLCNAYARGVAGAEELQTTWTDIAPFIDKEIADEVSRRMDIQVRDAKWWESACLQYFSSINGLKIPESIKIAPYLLQDLKQINLGITNFEAPEKELLDKVR